MRVPLQIFEFTCRLAAWQHDAVDVPCLLSVPLARLAEMADLYRRRFQHCLVILLREWI